MLHVLVILSCISLSFGQDSCIFTGSTCAYDLSPLIMDGTNGYYNATFGYEGIIYFNICDAIDPSAGHCQDEAEACFESSPEELGLMVGIYTSDVQFSESGGKINGCPAANLQYGGVSCSDEGNDFPTQTWIQVVCDPSATTPIIISFEIIGCSYNIVMNSTAACGTLVTPTTTPSSGFTPSATPTPTGTMVSTGDSSDVWLWVVVALAILIPVILIIIGGVVWFVVWKRKKSGYYNLD